MWARTAGSADAVGRFTFVLSSPAPFLIRPVSTRGRLSSKLLFDMQSPYAPPTAQAEVTKGSYAVTIPGVSRTVTVQRASTWSGAKLFVDGQLAERAGLGTMKLRGEDAADWRFRPCCVGLSAALELGNVTARRRGVGGRSWQTVGSFGSLGSSGAFRSIGLPGPADV